MSVPAGQVLGAYRLVQRIGRGGMGDVWLGQHLKLGREAAIKILPVNLAGEADFLKRFQREAASAASLEHPNILPVWDYGEQDHMPYLVMPYVSGGTLKDRLTGHGINRTEFLHFFKQMAEALDYAHERGLIHRDVKPANMLVDERNRLYLADFGIAKALEGSEGLTRTGVGVGTPEYMAPEQAQGHADTRSDLYALGIIAYQLLSGRVPYSGNSTVEVLLKHLQEPVPLQPLRDPSRALPAGLERLFQKALAKNPNDRYQSAMSLYEALDEALSGNAPRAAESTVVGAPDHTAFTGAPAPQAPAVAAASWTPPPSNWQAPTSPAPPWQAQTAQRAVPAAGWQPAPGATPPFGVPHPPAYGVPHPPGTAGRASGGQPWWLWGLLAAVVLLLGFGGVVALARGGSTATPTAVPATAVAAAPPATGPPSTPTPVPPTAPPPTTAPVVAPTASPTATTPPPTATTIRPTATTARPTNTPTPRPATTSANIAISPVAGPVGAVFDINARGLTPGGQYIFVIYNSANKAVMRTDANKPWVADSAGRLQLTLDTTGDPPDTYTIVIATAQGTERARARYTVTQ